MNVVSITALPNPVIAGETIQFSVVYDDDPAGFGVPGVGTISFSTPSDVIPEAPFELVSGNGTLLTPLLAVTPTPFASGATYSANSSSGTDASTFVTVTPNPDNDRCADATEIVRGHVLSGSTRNCTPQSGPEPGAPFCDFAQESRGVWYRAVGTGTDLTAETITASFDTKVHVYTDGCETLTCVVGDDDSGVGSLSSATWPSNVGQEYLVLVSGFDTASGTFNLRLSGPPPANNNCDNAETLMIGTVHGTLIDATDSGGTSCNPDPENEVYYTFTAPETGVLTVDTFGTHQSGFTDTLLSLHSSCPAILLTELTCDTSSGGDLNSRDARIVARVVAGASVILQVAHDTGSNGDRNFILNSTFQSNGTCQTADPLVIGMSDGTLLHAIADGSSSCSNESNASVYYAFTAPDRGVLTVDTFGTDQISSLNTTLSMHTACDADTMTELACSAGGGTARVSEAVSAGQTIIVRVSHLGAPVGDGYFLLNSTFLSDNSDCANATRVHDGDVIHADLNFATSTGASTCGSTLDNPDLWYEFIAPCDGLLRVDTFGTRNANGLRSGPDTVLNLHAACGPDADTEVACNDDSRAPGGLFEDSLLEYPVTAGERFVIRVAHFGGLIADGNVILNVRFEPRNDTCETAVEIAPNTSVLGTNICATADSPPVCDLDGMGNDGSVWYTFAGNGEPVEASTCNPGGNFDTVLRVYEGACDTLVCVAGNDDADAAACEPPTRFSTVQWDTTLGTNYYIAVGGFANFEGDFELSLTGTPSCICERGGDPNLIGITDILEFLDGWLNENGAPPAGGAGTGADVNADNLVNISDLLDFLSCYFAAAQNGGVCS